MQFRVIVIIGGYQRSFGNLGVGYLCKVFWLVSGKGVPSPGVLIQAVQIMLHTLFQIGYTYTVHMMCSLCECVHTRIRRPKRGNKNLEAAEKMYSPKFVQILKTENPIRMETRK